MDEDFCPPQIDRRRLAVLYERSDRAGFIRLAGHGSALAATASLVLMASGSWLTVPAMAIHGAVLMFLFAPLHECVHRTAFRSRGLNEAVAWVCGLILILPPEYFRRFHFAHHRYTQDPTRDPELARGKPATRVGYLWVLSGLPYWLFQVRLLLAHGLAHVDAPYLAGAAGQRVTREARLALAIYVAIALVSIGAGSPAVLLLWVGPALLGQPWLRAFLAAEHTLCPAVADMAANSRTTLSNALVRYFAWNMNYHCEHHLAPAIPFHRLAHAHAMLGPLVRTAASGYVRVQVQIWNSYPLSSAPGARRPA